MTDAPDLTVTYAVHEALRRELRHLGRVTGRTEPDPREVLRTTAGWTLLRRALDAHHGAEDEALWPALREVLRGRPLALVHLEAIEAEHALLARLVEEIDRALADPWTSAELFGELTGSLVTGLHGHLRHEEEAVLPLVRAVLDRDRWEHFGRVHARRILVDAARLLPWLLDGADRPTASAVLAQLLPASAHAVYARRWRPAYALLDRWGERAAPARPPAPEDRTSPTERGIRPRSTEDGNVMKILLTGATGYIGTAVAEHLAAAGHQVVALTRDPAPRPDRGWAAQVVGDTADPASLAGAVTPDVEAVVHLAPPSTDAEVDSAVIEALAAPLRGTGRPFVYTSGVWVLGPTGEAQEVGEDAPVNPVALVGYRPLIERQVLAEAAEGVRAAVVRPGIVYGRGGGIPAILVDRARGEGSPEYYGEEGVRWPTVHVDDLAALFVAVVERAEAGSLWHGVAEAATPVRELAVAAGRVAGVEGEPRVVPAEQAAALFGPLFADALALDQSIGSDAARTVLGWKPAELDVVAELLSGSYGPVPADAA
ncbi:NAD-dependent epimerase/dehydratase family protein [Kitasatospora sp. NPDC051853]|uniref:NAD-dependent epimerase/dehydratase family protein n=1 Tax=Kitasatospora sp. NPDC051853 TaxID=3364058 RepID=UPI0037BDB5A7